MVSPSEEAIDRILLIIGRKREESSKVKVFVGPDFGLDFGTVPTAERNSHAGKNLFGSLRV